MARIDAWPHWPTTRATIPSGEDPGNPDGWQDNLARIQTVINSHTHPIRIPHTWAIPGEIAVSTNPVPFFVPTFAAGQTATLKGALCDLESGTSVTCKLVRTPWGGSSADLASPYNAMVITPPAAPATGIELTGDVTLSAKDQLQLVITDVSTLPKNLTFTLVIEYAAS